MLLVFPKSKISKIFFFFCFTPTKSWWSRAVQCLCEGGRCVSMTERGWTEQDGKRSTESWDETKIEFGEKCNFPMTSVLFITNLKPSYTPGQKAALVHRIEERKGKTKGREELGMRERKKRRVDFGKDSYGHGQGLDWVGWPYSRGGLGLTDSAGAEPICCHLRAQHSTSHCHQHPSWGSWSAACYLQ